MSPITTQHKYPQGKIENTTTTENATMATQASNQSPIIEVLTLVFGVDVKNYSENGIIEAIERIDADVERIGKLASSSKALAARKARLNAARAALIAELDSRE